MKIGAYDYLAATSSRTMVVVYDALYKIGLALRLIALALTFLAMAVFFKGSPKIFLALLPIVSVIFLYWESKAKVIEVGKNLLIYFKLRKTDDQLVADEIGAEIVDDNLMLVPAPQGCMEKPETLIAEEIGAFMDASIMVVPQVPKGCGDGETVVYTKPSECLIEDHFDSESDSDDGPSFATLPVIPAGILRVQGEDDELVVLDKKQIEDEQDAEEYDMCD